MTKTSCAKRRTAYPNTFYKLLLKEPGLPNDRQPRCPKHKETLYSFTHTLLDGLQSCTQESELIWKSCTRVLTPRVSM